MRAFHWVLIACFLFVLFILFFAFKSDPPAWTGFGERIIEPNTESAKTLWDWLDLLIVPAAIVVFGWLFNNAEKEKARLIEEERAQNTSIESFINSMTNLIIQNKLTDNPNQEIKVLAQTKIALALGNLNGFRKGQILQFLYESYLISANPLIKLQGANLKCAVLDEIVLANCEIKGAYFNNASLKNARLDGATFIGCDFSGANLSKSSITNADLSYSYLIKAKLNDMDLTTVNLEGATLTGANLNRTKILQTQLDNLLHKEGIILTKCQVI